MKMAEVYQGGMLSFGIAWGEVRQGWGFLYGISKTLGGIVMEVDMIMNRWKRIMVIVPHQDDEVLMTGGVIRSAVLAGVGVEVVMATNGDCGCGDFSVGRARLRESLEGLRVLGLGEEKLHILGYADTGMPASDSFLTHLYEEKDGKRCFPSLCSGCTYGLAEKPEYHMQKYGVHADYCRDSFRSDLKEIILEKRPECIFTTSEYDMHGDHSALYRFVCEVLDEIDGELGGYSPELYTGIVHSNAGDDNWPKQDTARFDCPQGFDEETGLVFEERICIPVPEEMRLCHGEENLKYRALLQYETALEPGAYAFLMSFVKEEEIFWKVR